MVTTRAGWLHTLRRYCRACVCIYKKGEGGRERRREEKRREGEGEREGRR